MQRRKSEQVLIGWLFTITRDRVIGSSCTLSERLGSRAGRTEPSSCITRELKDMQNLSRKYLEHQMVTFCTRPWTRIAEPQFPGTERRSHPLRSGVVTPLNPTTHIKITHVEPSGMSHLR